MIKRKIQKITSKFGRRWGRKHKGFDLRSYTDDFKVKLPVILSEDCEFIRRKYQKKWGFTLIFKPLQTAGYCEIKYTHVRDNDQLIPGQLYLKGEIISYTTVTDYMRKKGYGEHLHEETWRYGRIRKTDIKIIKRAIDPEIYYEIRRIPFEYI